MSELKELKDTGQLDMILFYDVIRAMTEAINEMAIEVAKFRLPQIELGGWHE